MEEISPENSLEISSRQLIQSRTLGHCSVLQPDIRSTPYIFAEITTENIFPSPDNTDIICPEVNKMNAVTTKIKSLSVYNFTKRFKNLLKRKDT